MKQNGHVLVIGAAGVDLKGHPLATLQMANSNPGIVEQSFGGVGRNLAENIARLALPTVFMTALGKDHFGDMLLQTMRDLDVDMQYALVCDDCQTGTYVAVLDDQGELVVSISDFRSVNQIDAEYLRQHQFLFEQASYVVIDLNLSVSSIEAIVRYCDKYDVPLIVDPTSPKNAQKLVQFLGKTFMVAPNIAEAVVLAGVTATNDDAVSQMSQVLVQKGVKIAAITCGADGVIYATQSHVRCVESLPTQVVDATGAGDAWLAGMIYGLWHRLEIEDAIRIGIKTACLTLEHTSSTIPVLPVDLLDIIAKRKTQN